jgi:hypothetical protein
VKGPHATVDQLIARRLFEHSAAMPRMIIAPGIGCKTEHQHLGDVSG